MKTHTLIGYARVTGRRKFDFQNRLLEDAGCDIIFRENSPGDVSIDERIELITAVNKLKSGSTLVVTSCDILGVNAQTLLPIVSGVLSKGAGVRAIGEPWFDIKPGASVELRRLINGLADHANPLPGKKTVLTVDLAVLARRRVESGESIRSVAADLGISHTVLRMTIIRLNQEGY